MKLIQYLTELEISDQAFAALVQRSVWAVRKWKYGQRIPRDAEMTAIVKATGGAVTPNDFFGLESSCSGSHGGRAA